MALETLSTADSPLANRTVVVTGGTRGIGKEAARALALLGATVIIVGRDAVRGSAAAADLRRSTGHPHIVPMAADLGSLADVRRLAREITARFERVHVLVNNAAVVRADRRTTVDGNEETLAVGHLAPFLLTELLLPKLRASAPARIVNMTSGIVRRGTLSLDDVQSEHAYDPLAAYGRTKLLGLAWTLDLARRLEGTGTSVLAADPGIANTGTHRDFPRPAPVNAVMRLVWLLLERRLSPARAATSLVRAASAPELEGVTGVMLDRDGQPTAFPGAPTEEGLQRETDRLSRELVGLSDDGRGRAA